MLIVTSESRVLTAERNVSFACPRNDKTIGSRKVTSCRCKFEITAGQRFHVNRNDPVGLALIYKKRLRVRRKVQRSTRV